MQKAAFSVSPRAFLLCPHMPGVCSSSNKDASHIGLGSLPFNLNLTFFLKALPPNTVTLGASDLTYVYILEGYNLVHGNSLAV